MQENPESEHEPRPWSWRSSNRPTSINSNTTCQCPASLSRYVSGWPNQTLLYPHSDALILTHQRELAFLQLLQYLIRLGHRADLRQQRRCSLSKDALCCLGALGLYRNRAVYRTLNVSRHICRSTEPQILLDHQRTEHIMTNRLDL